ncbi:MAG: cadmium-translocating P-type ATPase [Nanoarchaeota archaeon]|nr:cadmium-translocating P-type ATPase [Nanoarchaeota archaeon]
MKSLRKFYDKYGMFLIPGFVFLTLAAGLILKYGYHMDLVSTIIFIIGIIPGSVQVLVESIVSFSKKDFAIDYIAILTITVSLATQQYLVGSIIVLMITGGGALERYAQQRAKSSLTALTNRIPHDVLLYGKEEKKVSISSVKIGQSIFVRKGEVIPLDGVLISEYGQIDESSLTGEPYFVDKLKGDTVRSGTINMGAAIIVRVAREDKDSTYRQIINMVRKAQEEKSPMIRLAHSYNWIFTLIALVISAGAWFYWHNFTYVLAVLVIATPCPLLLATPVALIGGMSASAKKKIIVKNLGSIEALARTNTLVFDKTGTITLGKPVLKHINILDKRYDKRKVLSIAEAIERNSLHPVAHSIIQEARREKVQSLVASNVEEFPGSRISGNIKGKRFMLMRGKESSLDDVHLTEGKKLVAEFIFEDVMKGDAKPIIRKLEKYGMDVHVFTGDKKAAADALKKQIDSGVDVQYEMSPGEKQAGIKLLKKRGREIAMIGDGINDAPALALADVGMVFSHEEHTASSEAADIVFLGGGFSEVYDSINISKKTMRIARQSMFTGIGLSILGMFFAAAGFIVPIAGAVIQEIIDVSVIFNSLRTLGIRR